MTAPNRQNVANRFDLTKRLVQRLKRNEAVIGGIGLTNFDLWAAGHRPENFYMLGSMGLAVPIAHGVAIAQPNRKVIALEGDGSILMQLGALGTVAARSPKNLVIIVWDNESYVITGAQATATASAVDLVAVAKGAGIAKSSWANDPAEFEHLVDTALAQDGPTLIATKIDKNDAVATTHRDPVLIRENFMCGIGSRKNAFISRG